MYGIFTYIWVIFRANVDKYSIHGASGICQKACFPSQILSLPEGIRRYDRLQHLVSGWEVLLGFNWHTQWKGRTGYREQPYFTEKSRVSARFFPSAALHFSRDFPLKMGDFVGFIW